MAELKRKSWFSKAQQDKEMISTLNKELYWTGWYEPTHNIQWTAADDEKKKQIEQEKT